MYSAAHFVLQFVNNYYICADMAEIFVSLSLVEKHNCSISLVP